MTTLSDAAESAIAIGAEPSYTGVEAPSAGSIQGSEPTQVATPLGDVRLSRFDNIRQPKNLENRSFIEIYDEIHSDHHRLATEKIRAVYADNGDGRAAKDAIAALKLQLPAVTFAGTFKRRSNDGWNTPSGLVGFDIDGIDADQMDAARAVLLASPSTAFLYVSPSGHGLKGAIRVAGMDSSLEGYRRLWHAVTSWLATMNICNDPATKDPARLAFICHDDKAYINTNAIPLDVDPYIPAPTAPPPARLARSVPTQVDESTSSEIERRARSYIAKMPAAISGQSGHSATFKVAMALIHGFCLNTELAFRILRQDYNPRCQPQWSERELRHKIDSVAAKEPEGGHGWLLHDGLSESIFGSEINENIKKSANKLNLTDNDQATFIVDQFHNDIRYCNGLKWMAYDGVRWSTDQRYATEYARQSARSRLLAVLNNGDRETINRALTMNQANHIAGSLKLAQSDPRVAIDVLALDCDPWLLNVLNGTLDLRTGVLRDHSRDDLITKLAPVQYRHGAQHPAFDRYLATLEAATPGLPVFLSRVMGMALTGDASAEVLLMIQGDGGAGKTTLTDAVAQILGDYAVKMQFSSFVQSRHGRSPGGATPDLVRLRGARFAYAAEGEQSARLDAGQVKQLTGNERVTARGLYSDDIEFPCTWKLFLVSNYDAKCDSDDSGLWRRILRMVFPAISPDQRDPSIKKAMTTDPACQEAILAWAVNGCLEWQKHGGGRAGLDVPGQVSEWTKDYQTKMDQLSVWWIDLMEGGTYLPGTPCIIPVREMRQIYETWASENGFAAVQGRRFNKYLEDKGLRRSSTRVSDKVQRVWRGILPAVAV